MWIINNSKIVNVSKVLSKLPGGVDNRCCGMTCGMQDVIPALLRECYVIVT